MPTFGNLAISVWVTIYVPLGSVQKPKIWLAGEWVLNLLDGLSWTAGEDIHGSGVNMVGLSSKFQSRDAWAKPGVEILINREA